MPRPSNKKISAGKIRLYSKWMTPQAIERQELMKKFRKGRTQKSRDAAKAELEKSHGVTFIDPADYVPQKGSSPYKLTTYEEGKRW